MKSVRPLVLVMLVIACSSGDSNRTASADSGTTSSPPATAAHEPTANDIADYKLDMAKMHKYAAAMRGFAALAKTDSAAAQAMGTHANETTAQAIARIESSPAALRVLRDTGLTAKDFVWITAAWLQAAMTQAVLESSPQSKLPAGQNPQNVEFLRAHRAELEAMTKDFEQQ
jgi:hypothetical protein